MRIHFIFPLVLLVACTEAPNQAAPETSEKEEPATPALSYDSLLHYIEHQGVIPWYYFNNDGLPNGALYGVLEVMYETDSYLVIRGHGEGGMTTRHYLVSMSKRNGVAVDAVKLGVEAEGVVPYDVRWKGDDTFTTIEYNHALEEDPESGAYMIGALKDSVIRRYRILGDGSFKQLD